MADHAPFDPANPLDALAECARVEVTDAFARVFASPQMKAMAGDPESSSAIMAGAMTGVCGMLLLQFRPAPHQVDELHAELHAFVTAYVPDAIDQARGIMGLPPLPRAS